MFRQQLMGEPRWGPILSAILGVDMIAIGVLSVALVVSLFLPVPLWPMRLAPRFLALSSGFSRTVLRTAESAPGNRPDRPI
jgi:hypothetical protein